MSGPPELTEAPWSWFFSSFSVLWSQHLISKQGENLLYANYIFSFLAFTSIQSLHQRPLSTVFQPSSAGCDTWSYKRWGEIFPWKTLQEQVSPDIGWIFYGYLHAPWRRAEDHHISCPTSPGIISTTSSQEQNIIPWLQESVITQMCCIFLTFLLSFLVAHLVEKPIYKVSSALLFKSQELK